MRAARIDNGMVVDLWEVPSLTAFEGLVLIAADSNVSVGWSHDGSLFSPPVPTTETTADKAANVRDKRDALLLSTDWVVIRAKELGQDVPLAIYNYRGDLRQIPDQAGFPHTIIWPEKEI